MSKLRTGYPQVRNTVFAFLFMSIAVLDCTDARKAAGEWIDLFNGKDLNDWIVKIHHYEPGDNFGETFRARDGMIQVRYDAYDDFNDRFGHLYYKLPFSRFHLSLEYRFTGSLHPGAPSYTVLNSGVMFHSQDPRTIPKEQNWPISVEMQFLAGLGDGKPRPTGNMCSPGTDIVYEGRIYEGHCLNSTSATYSRDEWVRAELIVLGDSLITHVINGDTVLQYSKPTMGGGVVSGYDSASWQPGKPLTSGYIGLQSEGQPIDFRNIRLKKL
ncbi:MAG TPA: DUF1080 domain-containing protein [Chryseosolibacter sp.]|nr:DUF1080 domain-containing protein [Chryseosolibacter sp.]